jgi:hypothetical protein
MDNGVNAGASRSRMMVTDTCPRHPDSALKCALGNPISGI